MGLDPKDPKPTQITIREAYTKIRQWYRVNVPKFLDRPAKEIETGEFKIVRVSVLLPRHALISWIIFLIKASFLTSKSGLSWSR